MFDDPSQYGGGGGGGEDPHHSSTLIYTLSMLPGITLERLSGALGCCPFCLSRTAIVQLATDLCEAELVLTHCAETQQPIPPQPAPLAVFIERGEDDPTYVARKEHVDEWVEKMADGVREALYEQLGVSAG